MNRPGLTKQIANGGVVTIAVTTLLSALLWFAPVFLFPSDLPSVPFLFMGSLLFGIPVTLSRVIAFFYWFVIWYIVNSECERLHIIPVRSVMPFVVGMAIVSAIPALQFFQSGMIAFAFFLNALITIFDLYKVSNQVNESFKVILFILISSLFVPEYIWMLVVFFLGLAVYKVRSARIFFSVLVALLVFVWMVWGICFVSEETDLFSSYIRSLMDFGFFRFHGSRIVDMIGFIVMSVIMFVVLIALAGISHKFDARVRLNISFIVFTFIFSVIILVVTETYNLDLIMVTLLPVTMLTSLYFSVQRNRFSNILFLVALSLLLIYRVASGFLEFEI